MWTAAAVCLPPDSDGIWTDRDRERESKGTQTWTEERWWEGMINNEECELMRIRLMRRNIKASGRLSEKLSMKEYVGPWWYYHTTEHPIGPWWYYHTTETHMKRRIRRITPKSTFKDGLAKHPSCHLVCDECVGAKPSQLGLGLGKQTMSITRKRKPLNCGVKVNTTTAMTIIY